jgi:regulatory protein
VADDRTASDLYQRALALLAKREHSRWELRRKLLSRFPNQPDRVNEVLLRLERETYQSDSRFAEAFVRMRQTKGIGAQRLRQELRMRGIEDHLIECALMPSLNENETLQQMLLVWQKKFAKLPADAKEKHRQMRFLLYRGFRQQDIESLFAHLKNDSMDL